MDQNDYSPYLAVIDSIRGWSAADRLLLARRILESLEHELTPIPRRNTLEEARGLLATDRPPPTDKEVKQWLEEERLKKYG